MNFNIIAYSIYLLIMLFITVVVGWLCYKNGEHYLKDIFANDIVIVKPLNALLLVGYYLINLGYIAISLKSSYVMNDAVSVIDWVGNKTGRIIILLACMHYFNIIITAFIGNRIKRKQIIKQ